MLSSPFLHGILWAVQVVRAGWVIFTSPLGKIFLFQNLVLLLILNGKWSSGTWLQKLDWEPHDAQHSSTLELAALCQPFFKVFHSLHLGKWRAIPKTPKRGFWRPGLKNLWFLSFLHLGCGELEMCTPQTEERKLSRNHAQPCYTLKFFITPNEQQNWCW